MWWERNKTHRHKHPLLSTQAPKTTNTYLPSLISSMKARPACFCNEFCHSCEHSSITNSTTELLFLKVVNPTIEWPARKTVNQDSWFYMQVAQFWIRHKVNFSTSVSQNTQHKSHKLTNQQYTLFLGNVQLHLLSLFFLFNDLTKLAHFYGVKYNITESFTNQ